MSARAWGARLGAGVSLACALALAQVSPAPTSRGVGQQAALEQEKERAFALAAGIQSGTVRKISVGQLFVEPYNPQSNLSTFLIPQITPIYQGDEKVTAAALVPGASVRVHFRYSPVLNQASRAIAVEILSVPQARAAKELALNSPPVMNEGRGLIPAVPPPEKQEVIAKSSGSMVGRINRLQDSSLQLAPSDSRETRRLRVDPFVSVFDGRERVGIDRLEQGQEVRVYYTETGGRSAPLIIAVELLAAPDNMYGPPAPKR